MRVKPHFTSTTSSLSILTSAKTRRVRHQLLPQIAVHVRSNSSNAPINTKDEKKPEISIGIIGGGISGLSTAYHIFTKWEALGQLPRVKVTLYEESDRLGGWLQSRKLPAGNHDEFIRVEAGPRTLSTTPISRVTLEMIDRIGIKDSIRWVHRGEAGARNRYVYLGENDLYRFPNDIKELFTEYFSPESKMRPAIHSALASWLTNLPRWLTKSDPPAAKLSLGQQMKAHFGLDFTANFLSAFVHGIYAGDIWQLSALARGPWQKSMAVLPVGTHKQPDLDTQQIETLRTQTGYIQQKFGLIHDSYMTDFRETMFPDVMKSFVFYLREGFGILSLAMESFLRMNYSERLTIHTNAEVDTVSMNTASSILVTGQREGSEFRHEHDYVVSAIPPEAAMQMLDPAPPWEDAQSVSVGLATLFWERQHPIKYDGFGYVISDTCPLDQNPHGALGVIFDSSSRPDQDTATGQKVTVLLGGPFWQPGFQQGVSAPTEDELILQARETLKIQIGVDAEPTVTNVQMQRYCIPQPTVRFMQSINREHNPLVQPWADTWNGRLFLTGPPVTGPGVHDSIMGGFQVTNNIMAHAWRAANPDKVASMAKAKLLLRIRAREMGPIVPDDEAKQLILQYAAENDCDPEEVVLSSYTWNPTLYHLVDTQEDVLAIDGLTHHARLQGPNCLWPTGVPKRYTNWNLKPQKHEKDSTKQ